MRIHARPIVLALLFCIATQLARPARACGPFTIDPVFVFQHSPDLPFDQFANGKIGILQSTFGRKTLVVAYHYLNGGFYSEAEQQSLVEALRGEAPEENGLAALKTWIAARRNLMKENEPLPEIYVERRHEGYDYFPNCAKNAFEVATATLNDRIATYGADDRNVRDWITGQDTVFENCSSGSHVPAPAPAGAPRWLTKDRDYQIAAAFFYSLNFDEARRRFASIAADTESPWQETAKYLVARTLFRQANLAKDEAAKRELFTKAEIELQTLIGQSPASFQESARKLLAAVKFRLYPQQRVRELARILANTGGNENLRQDLIDYVWLLDGIEAKIMEAEKKRKEALKPQASASPTPPVNQDVILRLEARRRGEIIQLGFTPKGADGKEDYRNYTSLYFEYDASESDILLAFESQLKRKLTNDEIKQIKEGHASSLKYREWTISPNRQWDAGYEGCYYDCEHLTFNLIPDYLRSDDLTDWILTLQTKDASAYQHALERWRNTESHSWLVAALIKADKSSPNIARLMSDAEKVARDAPEFPSVAYQLARLQIALGKKETARNLIDEALSNSSDSLPISAKNQFLELRAQLAADVSQFLKYSQRTPVAFFDAEDGRFGSFRELLQIDKAFWNEEHVGETKEEYEKRMEDLYKDRLPWDGRSLFDDEAVDILNWHFSLQSLVDAAHDQSLPDYLRRQLTLAAWTRAILFQRHELAIKIAPEVRKAVPEMASLLDEYTRAKPAERDHEALFVLLKFPSLSPFLASGLPSFETAEEVDYYFEGSWWCRLATTEYNNEGNEVAKVVRRPDFLNPMELEAAATERKKLHEIGDGKNYLARLVLEWARVRPGDPRIPESLFIAFKANESYKYGCAGWDHDEELQRELGDWLTRRYPESPWTAKLQESNQ